jgi:phycocyanobilin lyase subunit beta
MSNIAHLIQEIDTASTPAQLIQAVHALADTRNEQAIPTLILVLGYNNPSAAIAAMHGLVAIGRSSVESLMSLMDDYNYGARAYTVRALAMIGDPRALPILLNCAETDFSPSVRRAAIKGLGKIQGEWTAIDYSQILATLQSMLKDYDWSIRYAAIVALDALSQLSSGSFGNISDRAIFLLEANKTQEADLAVKSRMELALSGTRPVEVLGSDRHMGADRLSVSYA